ncbi:MAG: acyltransferase [Clostridium sp.]
MKQKQGRLVWVDQLKAIGMFFVIWGHSIQRCETKVILKGIYSFHMPFFFILSGLTLNPDKYKRNRDFLIAKAKSILYPYLIMSFVLLPLWYYNRSLGVVQDDSVFRIILGIFYSNSAEIRATTNAAWFMVTLFFAEFIFYLLYKYLRRDTELFLGSFMFALLGVFTPLGKELRDAPFHMDVALVSQFYVCAGFLIRKNFDYIMNLIGEMGKYKGVIIMLGVSAYFAMINSTVDFSNERYGNFMYTLISSFGITLSFIYIARYLPKIRLLSYIGQNTMIYLMVHVPILRTLQAYFPIIEHSRLYSTITAICLYFGILLICVVINKFFPFCVKYPKKKEVSI